MALTLVTNGQLSDASQLDQIINVLQRQTGQQESGQYVAAGWVNAGAQVVSDYYSSLSRGVTPSSASIDSSLGRSSQLNAPGTSFLSANGVQIFCLSSASANNATCGGNVILQF
jgi:hypothetical protein